MASVLTNFLVGIGWDTTDFDKGTRNVERSLTGVGTTVKQVGAAMVGAFGAKALTVDFARRTDQVNQFATSIGVSADNVQGLGNAFAVAGGEFNSALNVLQKVTDARDALAVKGEAGFMTDVAYAGIDPQAIINSKDAYSALMNIMRDFDKLSPERQRTLAQTLGLGPAELAFFKQGRGAVEAQIRAMQELRPVTEAAQESSRKLREQWALFGIQAGGIADQISTPLVTALADATEAVNSFIHANQPIIDSTIAKAVGFVSGNFKELGAMVALIGAGATLGTLGKLATFIPAIGSGLGKIALMASRLSFAGAAVAGGAMLWDTKPEDIEKLTGWKPPEWLFTPLNELTANKKSPRNELSTSKQTTAPYAGSPRVRSLGIDPRTVQRDREIAINASHGRAASLGLDQRKITAQAPLTVRMELDGRVLDERIVNVTERNNTLALEDVTTTTKR